MSTATDPAFATPLRVAIDIFSDVVCPWCFIGKRRLTAATAALPSIMTDVRWRAFELHPYIPTDGFDARSFFNKKFGGVRETERAFAHVVRIGAEEGIAFNFDFAHMRRAPKHAARPSAHQLRRAARSAGRRGGGTVPRAFRGRSRPR